MTLTGRFRRGKRAMRRRLVRRPATQGTSLYALIAVLLIVSWAFPPFAFIGVPFSILLAFAAILCIITIVFMPLVFGLY
jgi:hypothetical protein